MASTSDGIDESIDMDCHIFNYYSRSMASDDRLCDSTPLARTEQVNWD
jgi:hypothetical protein